MGQCVSQEPMFPHRQAILAPACNASVSDTSHDNHSHAEFSDSTVPENSNLDDLTKLDATSEYYDGVSRKHPTRKSLGKASIASFLPKVKGSSIRSKSEKDNHLSAAFNMSFNKFEVVRLDVNTATEEELMTLTGITRNIAHTIIEHRNVIGAFKKVEDLALVTGVGAAKLQTIKPEICIGKKVPSSTASIITGNPSINSLNGNAETISIASSPKPDRPRRQRRRDPVNINTASIFQLMTVDGITQELAAHLVHYREKKGPFKTLYDLRKVTGFNTRLISALGPYLALESSHIATPNGQQQMQNGNLHSHRRTASLPSGPLLNTGGFIRPTSPLLSSPSPVFPSLSQFTRVLDETQSALDANDAAQSINGDPVEPCENGLRILSWNLDGLSVEKAQNPGVVNVVGNLLTRYHIKIAIIEGIEDPLGLKELCENINKLEGMSTEPYLCTITDGRVGYLHRVALQVKDSTSCTQLPIHLATVEYFNVVLALVSCSLTNAADNTSTALVPQLVKSIMDLSRTERILCMVDLSQTNHSLYVEEFQNLGYRPVVPKGESTCYLQRKSEATKEIYSNVLVSRYSQKGLTGSCGVIRNGLTHILIPNGWSWNGPVSMFCPIWVEFKEDEEGD
ncbi:endonuclease/exonuclease/phosphatase family domain-containing protein 1-like [Daphnia pulicaria]|uniref:endonuclease/exonuclease/phosphatase family domain-containing protein 1-like n=1 Tax=Daphnia pulicaria TaxID=35523 RepID=UPI001EE9F9E0|nr:endonuclease/exonuclease/phosphatase family domain-containing protein 1-like [Daphnia pulicaria]